MKKVLITGQNSYIGTSFRNYIHRQCPDWQITAISVRGEEWKQTDFGEYDAVLHAAGKAHADTGNVSEEIKQEYYRVNCDLTKEVAEAAKASGVSLFIYLSSMIIYGESAPYGTEKVITADTRPEPANYYGDSKWQADAAVRSLESETFKTAVLRLPMVYGPGSRGNYPLLAKMAKKLPVFPDVENSRSMIYIENLCEFLREIIENEDSGIFYPQNRQYTATSHMVEVIADTAGRRIHISSALRPLVKLAGRMPGKAGRLANKAFGNSVYDKSLSDYRGNLYQVYSLEESIRRTEGQ